MVATIPYLISNLSESSILQSVFVYIIDLRRISRSAVAMDEDRLEMSRQKSLLLGISVSEVQLDIVEHQNTIQPRAKMAHWEVGKGLRQPTVVAV